MVIVARSRWENGIRHSTGNVFTVQILELLCCQVVNCMRMPPERINCIDHMGRGAGRKVGYTVTLLELDDGFFLACLTEATCLLISRFS